MHFGFCQTDVLQHYHKTFTFHDTTGHYFLKEMVSAVISTLFTL